LRIYICATAVIRAKPAGRAGFVLEWDVPLRRIHYFEQPDRKYRIHDAQVGIWVQPAPFVQVARRIIPSPPITLILIRVRGKGKGKGKGKG
jgi:hypothetical protein